MPQGSPFIHFPLQLSMGCDRHPDLLRLSRAHFSPPSLSGRLGWAGPGLRTGPSSQEGKAHQLEGAAGTGARMLPGPDARCSSQKWGGGNTQLGNLGSQRSSLLVTSGALPLQSPPYQGDTKTGSYTCLPTSRMEKSACRTQVATPTSCQGSLSYNLVRQHHSPSTCRHPSDHFPHIHSSRFLPTCD